MSLLLMLLGMPVFPRTFARKRHPIFLHKFWMRRISRTECYIHSKEGQKEEEVSGFLL